MIGLTLVALDGAVSSGFLVGSNDNSPSIGGDGDFGVGGIL